jgi:hypothetical protein
MRVACWAAAAALCAANAAGAQTTPLDREVKAKVWTRAVSVAFPVSQLQMGE